MFKNLFKNDNMKRSEHMAVRESVGWYFWTHNLLEVTGADAPAFLDALYTRDIANLSMGQDRYTTMLNDAGEIFDDAIIMRRGETCFWISTLFARKVEAWYQAHKGELDVSWEDLTAKWAMYAIQGPKSQEVVCELVEDADAVKSMKFFTHIEASIQDIACIVNRAGFTGEKLGYEIYVGAEDAAKFEELLDAAAQAVGGREVTEFQVMAWTLPCEAGLYYMRDLAHTNPFEVGLEKGINWDKDFVGKDALLEVRESGPAREMLGFEVLDEDFRIASQQYGGAGEAVYVDGEEVGRVVKLVYSYVKDVNNGYLLAKKDCFKLGDRFKIKDYDAVICERNWLN